ncbi:VapE domain-containing protein [Sphingobium sp. KCTC 72723]|uniref:VapE domain-containing protein n=1 Tax=Sphingobium sp. KCTC 72723 TaxID=2733867 RepID=UPI00165E9DCC|nr:VapE domain-containing protein [Sphingobium sp. KCTC 72723]
MTDTCIDDAKPHLTILPDTTVAAVAPVQVAAPTYDAMIAQIITKLTGDKLSGVPIDKMATLRLLDINEDNSTLREWLATSNVMKKPDFDKAIKRIARDARIEAALGFVPKDAEDLVRRYAEAQKVTLTPSGLLKRSKAFRLDGGDEVNASNCDTSAVTQLVYDVANAEGANLDSFGRELRLLCAKFELNYRDTVIGDALDTWREDVVRQTKVETLFSVRYEKGKATGPIGQKMWADMELACFDISATVIGFPTAVIKKFMWQVKRKARGMTVTNHLMPVLSGAQGKGKTHFVQTMTKPLEHFKREVDFNIITDGKTADIWSSLILFIDEMGFFKKQDVDVVKNVLTADVRSIRTMRQNSSAPIRNHSTFIGCTNKSLGQLIRDETGGRRFAELVWRNDPDWDALNAVDWPLLWQSVDETAKDPLIAAGMMETLVEQQEENRNQSPVEVWALEFGHTIKNWTLAKDMHLGFREWEKDAFSRYDTNQTSFGRQLSDLVTSVADFPFEKKKTKRGLEFRYGG